jgi:hypothetical protein
MSFVLKQNNDQIAISGSWNPRLFGSKTGTSFPAQVDQNYVWAENGFDLRWVDDPPPPPPAQPSPPESVSMRQARLALLGAGLLAQVDAAIQQGAEADKIEWEYATEVRRDSALVANMAAAFGLTEVHLDDLFFAAAAL